MDCRRDSRLPRRYETRLWLQWNPVFPVKPIPARAFRVRGRDGEGGGRDGEGG